MSTIDDFENELWKDIEESDGKLQISNYGRVKSFHKKEPTILKTSKHSDGFSVIYIGNKRFKVHRLVAKYFISAFETTNNLIVSHKNKIKTDNRVENLICSERILIKEEDRNKYKVKQVQKWRKKFPEKRRQQKIRERLINICKKNNILPKNNEIFSESQKILLENILNGTYKSTLEIKELNILKEKKLIIHDFKTRVRRNIRKSFVRKKWTKKSITFDILKCDYDTFKIWIESHFKENMSWENMNDWDLDHQIPISLANNDDEIIELCYYKNYQPLWKIENYVKQDNLIIENVSEENRILFKKFIDRIIPS